TLAAISVAAREPDAVIARLVELGVWTLTPLDGEYPARLRELDQPPPVIYGWGNAALLDAEWAVAVVGTRRPTTHGRALAGRVATTLADAGASVVSGLAIGIDGAAHAATVARGGRTVAVLGGGHARPGPRAHRALLGAILESSGAVIAELPPDAVPTRGTFPRRNRLISALAAAVAVIEAPARSGALITARHALEQGRPLYAAPGRPGDPATIGCLALLRETPARPLVGPEELLLDLGYIGPPAPGGPEGAAVRAVRGTEQRLDRDSALRLLAPAERAVALRICRSPAGADLLVSGTGLPPGVVAGALTLLQMRGWIQDAGGAYLPAGPLLAAG
ncbi:MAG: DNA-processing protein DprA, partial [Chloroflexota bacterium]|nr:DNA-processing protein DprA [Chloroflexota bacterium]